jgi:hypothetical protein
MVTAIVSPNARPKDKIYPAIIPDRADGTTTLKITSERVAPNE